MFILNQEQWNNLQDQIEDGTQVAYFKLVNIGPETMKKTPKEVAELCDQQDGYFILAVTEDSLLEKIYEIIDNFVEARNGK
jgi:hypothetical protein